jgi:uncharacterized protein YehS (DUF1456 family)
MSVSKKDLAKISKAVEDSIVSFCNRGGVECVSVNVRVTKARKIAGMHLFTADVVVNNIITTKRISLAGSVKEDDQMDIFTEILSRVTTKIVDSDVLPEKK